MIGDSSLISYRALRCHPIAKDDPNRHTGAEEANLHHLGSKSLLKVSARVDVGSA
jgi:hypothetical protein